MFSSSDNACVFVWCVRNEAVVGRVARHSGKVRDIAVWGGDAALPTGRALLVTGSFDHTVQVWDVTASHA